MVSMMLLSKSLLSGVNGVHKTRAELPNLNISPSLATKYPHFGHSVVFSYFGEKLNHLKT